MIFSFPIKIKKSFKEIILYLDMNPKNQNQYFKDPE